MDRGPIAEINLSSFHYNLKLVRRIVNRRPVIGMVKADAYGHGAPAISKEMISAGVSHLAVAFTGEAKILREAGISARILVLFDRYGIEDFFDYNLIPVIQDIKTARAISKEARRRKVRISAHLKVDTGMGRVGLAAGEAVAAAVKIAGMEGIEIVGLMSHFSEADLSDRSYALKQIKIFKEIRNGIAGKTCRQVMTHMGNSAAVLSLKEGLFDAVRPGILLYGHSPVKEQYGLRPLMRIRTNILAIRTLTKGSPVSYGRTFITKRRSKIAVLPVGYNDGYNRLFSNNSAVLVRGKRAPLVGRVCMDLSMVDVTEVENVAEGDEVVLLGRQGSGVIDAGELASRINTIPYEILTSLGSRARKEYIH